MGESGGGEPVSAELFTHVGLIDHLPNHDRLRASAGIFPLAIYLAVRRMAAFSAFFK
jgi:hypothetical protein